MKTSLKPAFILAATVALLFSSVLSANDDWPFWRGPDRNDISSESGLLKRWPQDGPKQLWVNNKAGLGYAGFAIANGRLFTMGLERSDEFALCLDADTGKEIWRAKLGSRFQNGWGDGPRSTPTIDGEYVYFMSAQGNLACLKGTDGQEKWAVKMQDFGGTVPKWGYAESPLVDGEQVVCTPGGAKTTIVALNKLTGKTIWKTKPVVGEPMPAHYSSILPVDHGGKRHYIQLTKLAVVGVDAENGSLIWSVPFPGRIAVIPSPLYDDGKVYVTAGYGVGSKMISLTQGNEASELWSSKAMQNHHGQVVKIGNYIYGSSAKAFVCQSVKDGSMKWADRDIKKGAITFADGLIYHIEKDSGRVLLLKVNDSGAKVQGEFLLSPQSERRVRAGKIWVHPVISNGKLYLRDQEFIHCYDVKK